VVKVKSLGNLGLIPADNYMAWKGQLAELFLCYGRSSTSLVHCKYSHGY